MHGSGSNSNSRKGGSTRMHTGKSFSFFEEMGNWDCCILRWRSFKGASCSTVCVLVNVHWQLERALTPQRSSVCRMVLGIKCDECVRCPH